MTRVENYLDALANMEEGPDYPKVTRTRVENYLDAICKNAGRRKVMPTAGPKYRGKIIQYVGESDGTYTKGYFYACNEEGSGTYSWSQIDVQPGGGGGGTPISAGKGIEIKDSAPLTITINVSGQLPPVFEGELPLTINVDNVFPGTTMWDLFGDGKISYEELFYWDSTYEVTTTLDENIASVQGPIMDAYMLQFNGVGTTTGTVTAERDEYEHEVYVANITVTSTAGEASKRISKRNYDLGADFMFAVMGMDYHDTMSGDEALEAFGGVDGLNAFVEAAANGSDFYASAEGQNIYFEIVASAPNILWIQHYDVGSMAPALYQIYYESGEDPFVEITKERVIDIFNDDFDGLVPKAAYPRAGLKFLRDDGVWAEFNGLRLDNTTAYTPTGNYNPATKKYVDDAVGNIDTLLANLISGGGAE